MSESTDAAAGGRRGGRTVSKSTPDEVMELACGLPLTRSVLRSVVAGATPGQLGVLADLFRAENASRTESRRARLIRNAGLLRAIGRARLLVIDELGYLPIDIDGARLLFQVVADSYEKRSVVFTTNLEFGRWGEVFGDGDMAAAVIDRIVHHGRIVRFRGESYRNSHSLMK